MSISTRSVGSIQCGTNASVKLETAGPKSVRSGNGRPLIALRCLMLMLVSTPLRIVKRCCSGILVSGGIYISGPLTFNV